MKSLSVTIEMKATKQYFPVVLFIMLYKVVLTFDQSVNEILSGTIQMKTTWVVLSRDAVCYAKQSGSNWSLWIKSWSVTIQMKATEYYFSVVLFILLI